MENKAEIVRLAAFRVCLPGNGRGSGARPWAFIAHRSLMVLITPPVLIVRILFSQTETLFPK